MCMPICVNDPLSTGSFNDDTFGCYCKNNAQWVTSTASCTCDTDYSEDNGECVPSSTAIAVVIPVAIGGAVCSGGLVFAGMLIRQKRR